VGDPKTARKLLEESREYYRRAGLTRGESEVIGGLGYVTMEEGDHATAVELFAEAEQLAAEDGFTWWQVGMLAALTEGLIELGRLDEAETTSRDDLRLSRKLGDRQSCLFALVLHAWLAAVRGDAGRAGLLWGAVEAEEQRAPVGQWELERENYAPRVLAADGPEFASARSRGAALSLEDALERALRSGRPAAGA